MGPHNPDNPNNLTCSSKQQQQCFQSVLSHMNNNSNWALQLEALACNDYEGIVGLQFRLSLGGGKLVL